MASVNFNLSSSQPMKKYIKWKFDQDLDYSDSSTQICENKSQPPPNQVIDAIQPSQDSSPSKITASRNEFEVIPPLPPYSPAADILQNVEVKEEIVNDDFDISDPNYSEDLQLDANQSLSPRERIMCKDFIRNKCIRGATCIYDHEIYLSQLKGVYKFCRDFENGRCKRSICYFVHASTYEKECFFRTAYLPEHTLAHLNNTCEDNLQGCSSSTDDPSPLDKKCKSCDHTLLRFQQNEAEIAQMLQELEELSLKINDLNEKNRSRCLLIQKILESRSVDLDKLLGQRSV